MYIIRAKYMINLEIVLHHWSQKSTDSIIIIIAAKNMAKQWTKNIFEANNTTSTDSNI